MVLGSSANLGFAQSHNSGAVNTKVVASKHKLRLGICIICSAIIIQSLAQLAVGLRMTGLGPGKAKEAHENSQTLQPTRS